MTAVQLDYESIPTEALDLRRDGLQAARLKVIAVLKDLAYLKDLADSCRKFGYALPYEGSDLEPIRLALWRMAQQIVTEED
jgi:hypothetical protein